MASIIFFVFQPLNTKKKLKCDGKHHILVFQTLHINKKAEMRGHALYFLFFKLYTSTKRLKCEGKHHIFGFATSEHTKKKLKCDDKHHILIFQTLHIIKKAEMRGNAS
jgi:predicted metallopeptidase